MRESEKALSNLNASKGAEESEEVEKSEKIEDSERRPKRFIKIQRPEWL